ncbi:MAG: ATP-binding protein [Thiohalophilus sp.]|uniref:sensor histidine kinase n=1 Tax=Thiohalophilus sp. TaxID=3028392 RepID=UPI00286FD3FF|nr:ATP-binding protein [Thiohalophilus sp.]MDR9437487.1 ATP-binding protein [Thiohalophilus sp.]
MNQIVLTEPNELPLRQALAEREAELDLLLETSQVLSMELDVDRLLQVIADKARAITHTRSVLIPILNTECTEYTYRAVSGEYRDEILGETLPLDTGICGWIWRNKQPWWQETLRQLPPEERLRWEQANENLMMVPLIGKKRFLGGIACMDKQDGSDFSRRDLDLLMLFANQAAIATENAMLYADRQELNNSLERRVAERTAELQQLNEEMEAFSYSVSHDLRAPLRAILGYSEALLEEATSTLPPAAMNYLQRIAHSAENMQALINALLELARLRHNPLHWRHVDLGLMSRELLEELQAQYPDTPIDLIVDEEITVSGDPQLLRIVMQNLLANAVKFSRDRQSVRIRVGCHREAGEMLCHVEDNGIGFDASSAERLFQPFQRLHAGDRFEGTGIGLATVARIIQRHGGRIHAESSPGEGACFIFSLPAPSHR